MSKYDFFQTFEEIWLEKDIITSTINDAGGELSDLHFTIEPTDSGWLFVVNLSVIGLTQLSDDVENTILDKMEALSDDIGEGFRNIDLDIDDLEDFKININ